MHILFVSSVGHACIFMLLCLFGCMFGWSFALLYDHCSHFHMTILVYDQVVHMFHNMFTWSHFTCYIILAILLLTLPWGSNAFCASVSGYKYTRSKCFTAFRFRCEWVLLLFPTFKSRVYYRVFCHGIVKGGDCKVMIYNYVLCWLYSMTKSVVIA